MKIKVIFRVVFLVVLTAVSLLVAKDWLLTRAQEWVTEERIAEIRHATALSQKFQEDTRALAHTPAARRRLTAAQVDSLLKASDLDNTLIHLRQWVGDDALGDALPRLLDQLEEHRQSEDRITWLGRIYLKIKHMRGNKL